MKLDFAFVADAATVQPGGKINVLGVFDRIRVPEFPTRHARIALVMRLATSGPDAGEHSAVIRLMGPEGEKVLSLDGNLRVGPASDPTSVTRIPHILNLDRVVFKTPGQYAFEIEIDGELAGSVPLILEERKDPRSRGGGAPGSGPGQGPEGVPIVFAPDGPARA
ncbi:MAG: hypothetical protein EA352_08720 [Gemmatimonadales bacterium]|nr:MAG: hypothetical protein EA352_08720 [Gemmatimonadales bacterium]